MVRSQLRTTKQCVAELLSQRKEKTYHSDLSESPDKIVLCAGEPCTYYHVTAKLNDWLIIWCIWCSLWIAVITHNWIRTIICTRIIRRGITNKSVVNCCTCCWMRWWRWWILCMCRIWNKRYSYHNAICG
jgi:hypothetical protein